jgi:transcriptional regulator with XRE-family HTH domain
MEMPELSTRELRKKLGLNQSKFWSGIGVTQSGGSRYENGRRIPRPVRMLLNLVYVERIDLKKIDRNDYQVLQYLKQEDRELFASLRRAATRKRS